MIFHYPREYSYNITLSPIMAANHKFATKNTFPNYLWTEVEQAYENEMGCSGWWLNESHTFLFISTFYTNLFHRIEDIVGQLIGWDIGLMDSLLFGTKFLHSTEGKVKYSTVFGFFLNFFPYLLPYVAIWYNLSPGMLRLGESVRGQPLL